MPCRSRESSKFVIQCIFVVLGLSCGCARQPSAVFTISDRVGELPELHQRNIEEGLRRHFGSPTQPFIMLPPSEEDESAAVTTDATKEGAAVEKEKLVDMVNRRTLADGGTVYRARCAGCHGLTGNGLGDAAAYLQPKPRDYRPGVFKFTSTPYGAKPTRQDLVRTIRRGAKGTSMPAFPWMSDDDLNAVVDYVIYLSQRGEVEQLIAGIAEDEYDEDEEIESVDFVDSIVTVRDRWKEAESEAIVPVSAKPAMDEDSIKKGRAIFTTQNCWSCHGKDGKGQTEWLSQEFLDQQANAPAGERIAINYDTWGYPAPAADLTARMLHGGRRPIDIYRRIYTGINGTPMPSFGQLFETDPDKIWHLVHYVLFVVEGGDPTLGMTAEEPAAQLDSAETPTNTSSKLKNTADEKSVDDSSDQNEPTNAETENPVNATDDQSTADSSRGLFGNTLTGNREMELGSWIRQSSGIHLGKTEVWRLRLLRNKRKSPIENVASVAGSRH